MGKGLPENAIQLIRIPGHEAINELVRLTEAVDLIIPRGGEKLIRAVAENALVPVIKHYKGVCHIYVDSAADQNMALKILENAKCQRPGVCNAAESLLVHRNIAAEFLPKAAELMSARNVQLRGDPTARSIVESMSEATEEDWSTEYLDLILSVKVVDSYESAVGHINKYGSHHSDAIITANEEVAGFFLKYVDSAAVYVNTSTRFTDGGEFGMGAEIGISTDKLHCRGPMGLEELTTYKYLITGTGQVRE
jgi:glutamate-5-semialdehyde dehydrogenase